MGCESSKKTTRVTVPMKLMVLKYTTVPRTSIGVYLSSSTFMCMYLSSKILTINLMNIYHYVFCLFWLIYCPRSLIRRLADEIQIRSTMFINLKYSGQDPQRLTCKKVPSPSSIREMSTLKLFKWLLPESPLHRLTLYCMWVNYRSRG